MKKGAQLPWSDADENKVAANDMDLGAWLTHGKIKGKEQQQVT